MTKQKFGCWQASSLITFTFFFAAKLWCALFHLGASKNRETPQNGWFLWKTLLKWMIWGYHYFRKHPVVYTWIKFVSKGGSKNSGCHFHGGGPKFMSCTSSWRWHPFESAAFFVADKWCLFESTTVTSRVWPWRHGGSMDWMERWYLDDQKFGHPPAEKMPVEETPQRIPAGSKLHFHVIFINCTLRTLLKVKLNTPKKIHLDFMKKTTFPSCYYFWGVLKIIGFRSRKESLLEESDTGRVLGEPQWKRASAVEVSGGDGLVLIRWKFRVEFLPQKNQDC